MPAPRYVNELQENAVWFCSAATWSVGGLFAWLAAANSTQKWVGSSSGLVLLAVLATAVSIAVRLPILSSPPKTTQRSDHAVWLLSTFASVNWLGFLVLQAPQWSDVWPVAIILLLSEGWFHVSAWRCNALPWLREAMLHWVRPIANLGVDSEPRPLGRQNQNHLDGRVQRSMVDGVDEQGRRYLSGEIQVAMEAGQTSESIVVSFTPAFVGAPEVDFDCESEGVDVQLINLSPAGMRLGIRRSTGTEPVDFSLPWYAAEVELGEVSAAAIVNRVLP